MYGSPSMAQLGGSYMKAVGLGCMVELHLRMAIDTGANPERVAYEPSVNDVLGIIGKQFSAKLQDGDEVFLGKVVTFRNKLVHGDFQAAHRLAIELGANPATGGVWKADLTSEQIAQVYGSTKKEGRIFGWFLEAGRSGLFAAGESIFDRALQTIARLQG